MREFFKPLRRKIGMVTLVLALLLSIEWVRSQTMRDKLRFRFGTEYSLMSMKSGILWLGEQYPVGVSFSRRQSIWIGDAPAWNDPSKWDWEWKCSGIHVGQRHFIMFDYGKSIRLRTAFWIVPHRFIVIPLTLLRKFEPSLGAERARRAHPLFERGGSVGWSDGQVS